MYPDVRNVKEKAFRATFEIKGKALYPKMEILFRMMQEILMESRLDDEKRLKEILAMLKSRLQMSFQSSGHTTAALRALSYSSPISKFKDDTDGIGYYQAVKEAEEHFEEQKETLIQNLKEIASHIFRWDNLMVSLTCGEEGLDAVCRELSGMKDRLYAAGEKEESRCILHCTKQKD